MGTAALCPSTISDTVDVDRGELNLGTVEAVTFGDRFHSFPEAHSMS